MADLIQHQLTHPFLSQLLFFELKNNRLSLDRLDLALLAHAFKEGVFDALFERDAEIGVEHKDLLQEVDGLGRGPRILCMKICSLQILESVEVLKCLLVSHKRLILFHGTSNQLENHS